MKLQDTLIDHVRYKGKKYRINADFRAVLKMFDCLEDKSLTPEARIITAADAVLIRPPRKTEDKASVISAVRRALLKETGGEKDRLTDFEQDADMIRAAFRQAYGIDLYREKLHWTEFTELLNNLPEDTRYMEIIGIRARPLPQATKYNGPQRQALLEAKAKYAIGKTEDEVKRTYNRDVNRLANALLMMAEKGSEPRDG